MIIDTVVQQHVQECAALRNVRSVLLRAPHVQLHRLRRLDERIAGHLDGIAVSGGAGLALLEAELADEPTPARVFALTVCALQDRQTELLERLMLLAAAMPEAERGFVSALGWVSSDALQGVVRSWLASHEPMHRGRGRAPWPTPAVDPGVVLTQSVQDADAGVRSRAWRVAGQLGRRDLAEEAHLALSRPAAWALTLWGMGQDGPVRRMLVAAPDGQACAPHCAQRLATMAAPVDWGREQVRSLAAQAEGSAPAKRRMVQIASWLGDVQVVPWLIQHMADDAWARLAGEAFSFIAGVDLVATGLERSPPGRIAAGPSDRPEDQDVAMDEDEGLPWPDAEKVARWWKSSGQRFDPGTRLFMGQSPSLAHCLSVLKTGGQRQRIAAAEWLCLLKPGTPLFNTAAPAWRQQRWLDAMGA